jgi:hypothetical protein
MLILVGLYPVLKTWGPDPRPEPPKPEYLRNPLSGSWYVELLGSNVPAGYIELDQSGNKISGTYFSNIGQPKATLSGTVSGTAIAFDYIDYNGMTSRGSGGIRPDGVHIDLYQVADTTGFTLHYTWHKGHRPH